MNNRFFKTAAKKTVFHGLAACFLYNILHLLESNHAAEANFLDKCLHWSIQNIGIPALATMGSEDLLHRLIGTNVDGEMSGINCLTSIFIALYTGMYAQDMGYGYTVPVTLYSMALYYNFLCSAENTPELLPSADNYRPAP